MANFQYNAQIDADLRDPVLEQALDDFGAVEAAQVAGLAELTDQNPDSEFVVDDDAEYVALEVAARAWFKKTK